MLQWLLNCRNYWKDVAKKKKYRQKILAFVKDEGSNLQTYASALTSIISCNNLGLLEPFDGIFFRHALLKVCQYAIANEKMSIGLPSTSIKVAQSSLQKCIA